MVIYQQKLRRARLQPGHFQVKLATRVGWSCPLVGKQFERLYVRVAGGICLSVSCPLNRQARKGGRRNVGSEKKCVEIRHRTQLELLIVLSFPYRLSRYGKIT